jgi:hypothetical protein
LYPNGRTLIKEKLKDLLDLCQYIPPVRCPFYKKPEGSSDVEDVLLVDSDPDDGWYYDPLYRTCQSLGEIKVAAFAPKR